MPVVRGHGRDGHTPPIGSESWSRPFPRWCSRRAVRGAERAPNRSAQRVRATARAAPAVAMPAGLDALWVPFAYDGVVRELIAHAKYRRRHAALRWLAGEMIAVLPERAAIDVVTWAPTTPARRRARGFDQAEILASCIAAGLGRPLRRRLRRRPGAAQTGASRSVREVRPEFVPLRRGGPASVLLVDDVVTTGATMTLAARARYEAAARIEWSGWLPRGVLDAAPMVAGSPAGGVGVGSGARARHGCVGCVGCSRPPGGRAPGLGGVGIVRTGARGDRRIGARMACSTRIVRARPQAREPARRGLGTHHQQRGGRRWTSSYRAAMSNSTRT